MLLCKMLYALLPAALLSSSHLPLTQGPTITLQVTPSRAGMWLAPGLAIHYNIHARGYPVHVRFTGWVEDVLEIRYECGAHYIIAAVSDQTIHLGGYPLPLELIPGQSWYLGDGPYTVVSTTPHFQGVYERSHDQSAVILRIPLRFLNTTGKLWLQAISDDVQTSSVIELDVLTLE